MDDMPEPDKRDPQWWEEIPVLGILVSTVFTLGLFVLFYWGLASVLTWLFGWWTGGLFRWFGW